MVGVLTQRCRRAAVVSSRVVLKLIVAAFRAAGCVTGTTTAATTATRTTHSAVSQLMNINVQNRSFYST